MKTLPRLDPVATALEHSNSDDVAIEIISDLRQSYNALLNRHDRDIQKRVVNLELVLLNKLLTDPEMPQIENLLTRLEDLYVSRAHYGFTTASNAPNEKLEDIGKRIERKKIAIQWSKFPIMETFLAPNQYLDRIMDAAEDWAASLKRSGLFAKPPQS